MPTILAEAQSFVIQPHSYLNASNAIEFKGQVTTLVAEKPDKHMLVDMEQVEFLDSAGLMALVYSLRLAQSQGIRFGLCSVSPSIRIIFELTQLDRVFEVFESLVAFEAALAV